jgi:hypothetical protein
MHRRRFSIPLAEGVRAAVGFGGLNSQITQFTIPEEAKFHIRNLMR